MIKNFVNLCLALMLSCVMLNGAALAQDENSSAPADSPAPVTEKVEVNMPDVKVEPPSMPDVHVTSESAPAPNPDIHLDVKESPATPDNTPVMMWVLGIAMLAVVGVGVAAAASRA